MLRFDYQPNKCIFAAQDLLLDNDKKYWEIGINKTCCNLYNNDSE